MYVGVVVEQQSSKEKPERKNFFPQNYFRNTIVKYLCVFCVTWVGLLAANSIVSQKSNKKTQS